MRELDAQNGRHRFQIEGELHKDIQRTGRAVPVAGVCSKLQSASMSLEDIFLKLTTAEEVEKSSN